MQTGGGLAGPVAYDASKPPGDDPRHTDMKRPGVHRNRHTKPDANKVGSAPLRTYRYQRLRRQILARDMHRCQVCLQNGIQTPAVEVDHVIPRQLRPDLTHDPSNMQALCATCHHEKTQHEQGTTN